MANSRKKCKQCGGYFPASEMIKVPAGTFCTMGHAVEFANDRRKTDAEKIKRKIDRHKETIRRRELLEFREKNKPISKLKAEAQSIFNKYVRARDSGLPCISCGRVMNGAGFYAKASDIDASHYRSRGAAPQLSFNLHNVHSACTVCNRQLSGNIVAYRSGLIKKIGEEKVLALESNNVTKKFDREYLERIKRIFRKKVRKIERKMLH